jgi:4Fe-4S ferredoxin
MRYVDLKKLRRGSIEITEGCIDCRLCVENCPTKAVKIYHGKPVIDESRCIYCEICSRICPMDVIDIRCDSCRIISEAQNAVSGEVYVDEASCSMCGICTEVCPVDAIKVTKLFEGEQKWSRERCFAECTVCRDVCPNEAISYYYEPAKVVVFSDRCNFCGACERYCPGKAIEINRKLSEELEVEFRKIARDSVKVIKVNEYCIGCGICESTCPLSKDGKTIEIAGGSVVTRESAHCTACGLCMQNCPVGGISIVEIIE